MLLLKFAGLAYSEDRSGYGKEPKGKLPYINDALPIRPSVAFTSTVSTSMLLMPEQRAAAWAAEKMCEEHHYFALVATRWLDDANFAKGPAQFFKTVQCPSGRSRRA